MKKKKKRAREGVNKRKKGKKTIRTVGPQGCLRWRDPVKAANKEDRSPLPESHSSTALPALG